MFSIYHSNISSPAFISRIAIPVVVMLISLSLGYAELQYDILCDIRFNPLNNLNDLKSFS